MNDIKEQLLKTPLNDNHIAHNARMVPFAGWNMPVQYEDQGILAEYQQTRDHVALFDISHMGEFIVEGDLIASGLDNILTMTLTDLPVLGSRYGCICNEHGGVIDDCIVFRMETNKWFVVVNGATREKDAEHFKKHLKDKAVFTDVSDDLGKIDIQGPLSREVLSQLVPDIAKLEYFAFDYFTLLGEENVLISRTGYTGELGYEIFFPWHKTEELWNKLLEDKRVKPAGLGARDILRLEMGYSLYGHELNDTTTPLTSGLNRFVDLEKTFIGRDVLVAQKETGLQKRLVGFISKTRRSPREGQNIYNAKEELIGAVTSGCFGPSVGLGIGLGFVDTAFSTRETKIFFGDDKRKVPAIISSRNFYKDGSIKS
ncbi:MAG: aminomethyltransferase [Candidatus Omnitrophota bacterium]|jgi:aminomethyltransferase